MTLLLHVALLLPGWFVWPGPPSPPPTPPARVAGTLRVEVALPWRFDAGAYRWVAPLIPESQRPPDLSERLDRIEERVRVAYDQRIEPLLLESERCAVGRGPHDSPEAAEAFRKLVSERHRAVAYLESLQRDLLLALCDDLALDEVARDRIACERLVRLRESLLFLDCDLPPAGVTLEPHLLRFSQSLLDADRAECLAQARRGYAEEAHSLHSQRVRLQLRDSVNDAIEFTAAPQRPAAERIESRRRRSAARVRVERLLVEANRNWTRRIAECLDPKDAKRFVDAVLAKSYPAVYPNPYDLVPLTDELVSLPAMPAGVGDQLVPSLQALSARMEAICLKMEGVCLDAWEPWALTRTGQPSEQRAAAIASELVPLEKERRETTLQAIDLVRAAGLPASPATLDALLSRAHDRGQ